MADERNSPTLDLVQVSTDRDPESLLRELYVEQRHSDRAIAAALTAALGRRFPGRKYRVSRSTVNAWRASFGIERDDRQEIAL